MKSNKLAMLFAIASLFMAFTAAKAQVSIGGTAGFNMQNITGKDANNNNVSNKLAPRYTVGLNFRVPLATEFVIQPGISFATKGAQSSDKNTKTTLNYVEIPINLIFRPLLGDAHILLGFGPYVGFGVGGRSKTTISGVTVDRKVVYKNSMTTKEVLTGSEVYVKPIDAGINLLAGYEFTNGFSIQFNAQLGLTKINTTISDLSSDKTSLKNTGFGVSLGYRMLR